MGEREGTTHYDVLGVAPDASATDIRRAFQRLTLVHHPDRNRNDPSAGARMAEINAAYRVLRDRQKRREYDASLPSQTRDAAEDVADDPFRDARTHWERADPEQQEWREYVREVQDELKGWTDDLLQAFVQSRGLLADNAASFEERSMHQWFANVALEEIESRWREYVREVQAELKGWTDSLLQAFVLDQGVLADNAASYEERSMHQWFANVALEEIESRKQSAERERAEGEQRWHAELEMHRRAAQERAEQARREQRERAAAEQERAEREQRRREERQRAAQQSEISSQPHDEAVVPPAEERQPGRRAGRILRRMAARMRARHRP